MTTPIEWTNYCPDIELPGPPYGGRAVDMLNQIKHARENGAYDVPEDTPMTHDQIDRFGGGIVADLEEHAIGKFKDLRREPRGVRVPKPIDPFPGGV